MLIMSYEHKPETDKGDFTIDEAVLFRFPEEDLIIIEQDWIKIVQKVREGKAHEISEGDTLYLGACTKGATAASVRLQPFSPIKAKQRAYSLKQSYMTYILNTYIYGTKRDENIIKDASELRQTSFEQTLIDRAEPYIGKTQKELLQIFSIESKAKNVNELILAKILGAQGKVSKTEEFQKANIIPKTIRIKSNGTIKENMSFNIFKFKELVTQNWEDSEVYDYFSQTKFLFMIFRFNKREELIFERIQFWNMPESDFSALQSVWESTAATIRDGVALKYNGKIVTNNLPKQTENEIAHVRPHSEKSAYRFDDIVIGDIKDANELPDGRWMTTQSFWLNNDYILKQINTVNT